MEEIVVFGVDGEIVRGKERTENSGQIIVKNKASDGKQVNKIY